MLQLPFSGALILYILYSLWAQPHRKDSVLRMCCFFSADTSEKTGLSDGDRRQSVNMAMLRNSNVWVFWENGMFWNVFYYLNKSY